MLYKRIEEIKRSGGGVDKRNRRLSFLRTDEH